MQLDDDLRLAGYSFEGWNTKPNGTGIAYELGESVRDIAANGQEVVYLYAQWDVDAYTVNFDGGCASGGCAGVRDCVLAAVSASFVLGIHLLRRAAYFSCANVAGPDGVPDDFVDA